MRWRLSLLLFLLYSVPGAVQPFFTLRLQELGFGPLEMSWACSTSAIAAVLGPIVAGQVADRWWPIERCLLVLALAAAVMVWVLAGLTSAWAVILASLAFWIVTVPAMTLGTALCFAHLEDGAEHFGRVRLWGTVGWAMPGWLLGWWFSNPAGLAEFSGWLRPDGPQSELSDVFRLSSLLALVLAGYTLTLPHTPPRHDKDAPPLAILSAVRLLADHGFAVYFICYLGICVTLPFMMFLTPLLLEHLGLPRAWIGPTMTISQSTEVLSLALLPMLLLRLGVRGTMLLGLTAWAATLCVLTAGDRPLVIASLAGYGVCICCFLVAGQVFVNNRARGGTRASVQALITFTGGVGLLVGNLLVGGLRRLAGEQFPPVFGVAAILVVVLALTFVAGFPDDSTPRKG